MLGYADAIYTKPVKRAEASPMDKEKRKILRSTCGLAEEGLPVVLAEASSIDTKCTFRQDGMDLLLAFISGP
jgi:hypothetical protein